jgi:hypothetical protein
MNTIRIAFCTSCMNRRWQMSATLPDNLGALVGTPHILALCDFNSSDDLEVLVRNYRRHIDDGRLVVFRTTHPSAFHASKAKNTAHRLGLSQGANVLFNLDADNYVGTETIGLLEDVFARDANSVVHNWSRRWRDGSGGRIAMSAENWKRLGGYDETLTGMAWQDMDLLVRSRSLGLRYLSPDIRLVPAIPNTMEQKLARVELPPGFEASNAQDAFQQLNVDNFMRSLSRPLQLDMSEQQRYTGLLNFASPTTI